MIKEIIPQFPSSERQVWQEAANSWRLPFWDWAANPKVPNLAVSDEVTVTAPPGVTIRMDNPPYKFQMPNDETMGSEGVGTIKGDEDVELAVGGSSWICPCSTSWLISLRNSMVTATPPAAVPPRTRSSQTVRTG